jgi:hypothetical protein
MLLTLLAALLVVSQSEVSTAPRPEVAAQAPTEAQRILHLRSGDTVRGRMRPTDAGWEYLRGREWTPVEGRLVERVELERDVLARARELERHVDRRKCETRVPYADWLLREGLLAEGLEQLDLVLEIEPDQPQARALIARLAGKIVAPGSGEAGLAEAVRAAAVGPRTLQELAVISLAARDPKDAVLSALRDALGSHSLRIRSFAALAIRRIEPVAATKELVTRAVLDGSAQVRRECSLALRDVRDEAVTLPVLRALGSKTSQVRENAIDALGAMNYPAAIEPLVARLGALAASSGSGGAWKAPASHIFVGRQHAYIQDFDVEVAQGAAVADPQVNTLVDGAVLDVRVIGVSEMTVAVESRKVRTALEKLTGARPGDTNRAWLQWWDSTGKNPPPASGPRPPASGERR